MWTDEIPDVSDAVHATCAALAENLPPEVLQDSNSFRARFCYIEQTDNVLRRYYGTICALYTQYSMYNEDTFAMNSQRLMSNGEFHRFVSNMGLIEDEQVSDEEVKLIFLWSRIRSVQGFSVRKQESV